MTDTTETNISSISYLLSLLDKKDTTRYKKSHFKSLLLLDTLLESYTDDLALRFQRALVNRRAVEEKGEEVYVINNGRRNVVRIDLDIVSLSELVKDTEVTFQELFFHTKSYGRFVGTGFQSLLLYKLKEKLDHVSGFIQNQVNEKDPFRIQVEQLVNDGTVLIRVALRKK